MQLDTGQENKKTLFVRNVSWNVSEEDLKEHFEGCATVRLPKRPDGKLRGYVVCEQFLMLLALCGTCCIVAKSQ